MLSCINKNSKEFRDLVQMSGLPESHVEAYCRDYIDKFNRLPYLDELPHVDSENHLRKKFNIKSNNTISINNLLNQTGKQSIDEALSVVNNTYRDLETSGLDLGDGSLLLDIQHKPTKYIKQGIIEKVQDNTHSALIIDELANKLSTLYGMPIISLTTEELMQEIPNVPEISISKAFIYNNNIYINTDNATLDSKVHELLHLFFGSMKYINSDLYYDIVSKAQNFKHFDEIAKQYKNRTRGDLLEEVFVTELSKYLTGLDSDIHNLSDKVANEIFYQVNRLLDISFMGDYSVRAIPINKLFNLSLSEIGRYVNSAITSQSFKGSIDDAKISRILANEKSQLIREGKLKEYC